MLLLNAPSVFAQSGFILSWDSEVGCLNYSEDRKNEVPLEEIALDECLLACENSEINFELIFDQQEQNVESIDWEPENGILEGTSNNDTSAKISWPNPTDDGGVTVHIVLENGEEIYSTICVEVKPNPDAKFIVDNNINQFFCSHIDIDFTNVSQAADGYQIVANHWDFGDGSSSNAENPVHSYDQSGTYEVTLTVYDECGCNDIYKETVHVTKPGLEISCPTVTCEGSIETYSVVGTPYTDDKVDCKEYKWIAEGGHIVQQQDDWVDVIWDDVDKDGFGYLYFDQSSCNVACQNQLVAKIPVVTKQAGFTGGFSQVDLKASANIKGKREIICHEVHNLTFPNLTGNQTNRVELSVSPNPVQTTTAVQYKVKTPEKFDRGTMVLYSLSGTRVETRPVKAPEGTETFDLSGRAAGNYVLVFFENGHRLGQLILIKN